MINKAQRKQYAILNAMLFGEFETEDQVIAEFNKLAEAQAKITGCTESEAFDEVVSYHYQIDMQ